MELWRYSWSCFLILHVSMIFGSCALSKNKEHTPVHSFNNEPALVSLSRQKRQVRSGYRQSPVRSTEISITFINKSGRRIRMFHSSPYGHEITFQFILRPNEPRRVIVRPDGSFWVAYDVLTNYLMLINGNTRLETYQIRPGAAIDAKISSNMLRPEPVLKDRRNPRFLETRVIVDKSMADHHGVENVFNYTLILMNIVTRSFIHRSLGAPIYVSVVDINIMLNKPAYYRIIPERPEISVASACRYGRSLQTSNRTVDFSLILTRENIGPEGYASMFTMCTNRSCALVKEKGPDSAFVIAHEMAHALGIDHDEDDSCPRDNLSGGNFMVKKLYATSYNYRWSRCSQKMAWQNLKYFGCLSNKPQLLPSFKASMDYMPGELMSMNEQCKHYHGNSARACKPMDKGATCRYLWCHPNPFIPCRPVWWHSPLEGSPCEQGKWCIRGKCVKVVKRISVDGGWSSWSSYTPRCDINTRKMMFQTRNRTCTNPRPQFSGKKCEGESVQHRVVLPTSNGICKPYSLKSLLLNSIIESKTLHRTGCENITNNSTWRIYRNLEQRQQVEDLNLTCNFESEGCAWRSSERGVKSWNIGRGRTPSANTGPSFDHTYKNTTGQYLYFEASWISGTKRLEKGDRVILQSPRIMTAQSCLRFAYHMYGRDVNALEVYIRNGRHSKKMWHKKGNQGDKWFTAEINLAINIEYQISIEAVKGATYYSDIAVDDISLQYGSCNDTTGENQRENETCSSICVNDAMTKMIRRQLPVGYPCKAAETENNVCFNRKCVPVNCHGVIGGTEC